MIHIEFFDFIMEGLIFEENVMVMKNVMFFLMMIFVVSLEAQSNACTPFFTFNEGAHWKMESFNKKDKLQSKMSYKILSVEEVGETVKALVSTKIYDKKDNLQMEMDYEVSCTDGVYHVDLSSVLSPEITKAFEGMEMEIEGQEMTLPADLTIGMELPDADTKITVQSSGIQIMSTSVRMINRTVEGQESLEVPAGTYSCYKITSDQEVKAGFINRDYTMIDYYAPGVGMVRSETYDKKGKLDSYMIMTEFHKGL